MPLLKQLLKSVSAPQLNHKWPQLKVSALIWCIWVPLDTSPSLLWSHGRQSVLSRLLLACTFLPKSLPPSLSVSHFCRMFLLSCVPIVHTLSWLASQRWCWLLGPLIGSSCALAFLAHLGHCMEKLALVSQTTDFWRNFCREGREGNCDG